MDVEDLKAKIAALEVAIQTYEEKDGVSDRLIAAQAAEIERLNEIAAEMVELRYRANEERIAAEATVRIQAAEIERMQIKNTELEIVMDQLTGLLTGPITVCKVQRNRIAELNAEIERLRAAPVMTWQPTSTETEVLPDGTRLYFRSGGETFSVMRPGCMSEEIELPDGYAIFCKVQP